MGEIEIRVSNLFFYNVFVFRKLVYSNIEIFGYREL